MPNACVSEFLFALIGEDKFSDREEPGANNIHYSDLAAYGTFTLLLFYVLRTFSPMFVPQKKQIKHTSKQTSGAVLTLQTL